MLVIGVEEEVWLRVPSASGNHRSLDVEDTGKWNDQIDQSINIACSQFTFASQSEWARPDPAALERLEMEEPQQ